MAKAFSTEFHYQNNTYLAVLSLVGGFLYIYLPDETLHTTFPKGRIAYDMQQGLTINIPGLSAEHDILLSILNAIEVNNNCAEFDQLQRKTSVML